MTIPAASDRLPSNYRSDIDGLRAISVLLVVLCHAYPAVVPGGFIGVDIFFVISGYLISLIMYRDLEAHRFSFIDFYRRRILRIFPALLFMLLLVLAAGAYFFTPKEFLSLATHIIAGATFSSNLLLYREIGYFDTDSALKPLLHLWSLGVEEQFYIIWPILVVLCRKWRCLLSFMVVAGSASFINNVTHTQSHAMDAFYLPHSRFWELLAGAALAYFQTFKAATTARDLKANDAGIRSVPRGLKRWGPDLQSLLSIVLLTIAVASINSTSAFPGFWALLPVLAGVFMISAGQASWINRALVGSRPMAYIGRISYPLYLFHWPLLVFPRILDLNASKFSIPISLGSAFLLAIGTYHFIELPLRRLAHRTPAPLDVIVSRRFAAGIASPAAKISLSLIAGLLSVGLIGGYICNSDGMPGRWKNLEIFDEPLYANWRQKDCFLDAMTAASFAPSCVDPSNATQAPLTVLWGDSIAAQLYPGFANAQKMGSHARIAEFTASLCPPLLNYVVPWRPFCKSMNDSAFENIKKLQPKTVILSADWVVHRSHDPELSTDLAVNLTNTVRELRNAHVERIILIGIYPRWTKPLPRTLLNATLSNWDRAIPTRLIPAPQPGLPDEDTARLLDETSRKLGIEYFRPKDVLCTEAGCLTTVVGEEDHKPHIIGYDMMHFSNYGAIFLVREMASRIGLF